MIQLTRKVFTDLAICMIGFGVVMGVVFPFFVTFMGVPHTLVKTPWFFAACILAGILVGAFNIVLAKVVIGRRLRLLSDRMGFVESNLRQIALDGDPDRCSPEDCFVPVNSDDEIGESAQAFNHLVEALTFSHETEAAVRDFNRVLGSQLELDVLCAQALEHLIQQTGASGGAILVETDGDLSVVASHGIRSPAEIIDSDHVRLAMRTEKRQKISLPEDIPLQSVLADFQPREVLIDPLLYKGVPLGAMVLASSTDFNEQLSSRLDLLRHGLALALNNALAHDRLQRLAAIDPLTGVYNRRFGMARLREEFGRSVRQALPLGVLSHV